MVATPAPLRDSRFRPFFFGRLVSMLGDSMGVIALSLAVLGASGRPSDLGIVLAAQMLPRLLLLLLGGVVADRWSRRTLLIWSSLGSAVTQLLCLRCRFRRCRWLRWRFGWIRWFRRLGWS